MNKDQLIEKINSVPRGLLFIIAPFVALIFILLSPVMLISAMIIAPSYYFIRQSIHLVFGIVDLIKKQIKLAQKFNYKEIIDEIKSIKDEIIGKKS